MKMNKVRNRNHTQTMRWGNMHPRYSPIASQFVPYHLPKSLDGIVSMLFYTLKKTHFDGFFGICLILYENFQNLFFKARFSLIDWIPFRWIKWLLLLVG